MRPLGIEKYGTFNVDDSNALVVDYIGPLDFYQGFLVYCWLFPTLFGVYNKQYYTSESWNFEN